MRRTKKSELKVFKLRSGEEIIAKVSGKSKDKIKLFRPMRITNNIQTDPYSGTKRHVVFFSDWLGSSADIEADIPLDFIVVELPPDPDMISLYSRQTEVDDKNTGKPSLAPLAPPSLPFQMSEEKMKKMSDEVDEKFEKLLKDLAAEGMTGDDQNPTPTGIPPFLPFPPFSLPKIQKPEGILFSIAIPNDIMNSWIESGVIDYLKDCIDDFINTEFIEELMNDDTDSVPHKKKKKKNKREKISKEEWSEPSEDLKKKPNYGNSHEDWSPYLKDYLPEQEPPKNQDGA